jgi:hypothetical protein
MAAHHRLAAQQLKTLQHHRRLPRNSSSPPFCCHRHLSTKGPPLSNSSQDNSSESNPLLKISNKAQEYESRHSTGLFGFNTHDGPVPIRSARRAAAAAKLKQQRFRDDENHSLIDPFYTPKQPDQTHLIQGGTPYDLNVGPAYKLTDYGESSAYTLILLRHGESEWNVQNRYTGWTDVNLTKRGEDEAHAAGRLLAENGIEIDHAFTSVLKRASFTLDKCLQVAGQQ